MRTIALIDGFNLFFAIRRLGDARLERCDVRALISFFLQPRDRLTAVYYYAAYPHHRPPNERAAYHGYTKALAADGVKVVEGRFKKKRKVMKLAHFKFRDGAQPPFFKAALPRDFAAIGGLHKTFEEKETDVNLAVDLIDLGYRDEFGKCLIVSGDSDLTPAIARALERFPAKRFVVLAPPLQKFNEARNASRQSPGQRLLVRQITRDHIAACRRPD